MPSHLVLTGAVCFMYGLCPEGKSVTDILRLLFSSRLKIQGHKKKLYVSESVLRASHELNPDEALLAISLCWITTVYQTLHAATSNLSLKACIGRQKAGKAAKVELWYESLMMQPWATSDFGKRKSKTFLMCLGSEGLLHQSCHQFIPLILNFRPIFIR